MHYYNCKTYNAIHDKNVVIHTAGQEVVKNLELCTSVCNQNGALYGKVTNQFGQPVAHAIVKIVSATYEPVLTAKTDHLGNYLIVTVPPHQPYKVIATAEGYDLSNEIKICLKEQEKRKIDIFLCRSCCKDTGVLAGIVLNKLNALPIEKAQVVLFEEVGGVSHFKNRTETNECGQFALTRLAPGAYLVQINMLGYIGDQYRVTISTCGQIVNCVTSLCPNNDQLEGTVSGVITDCQQRPIADADVLLYRIELDNQMTPIAYTRTNSSGVYLFINVKVGTYKVLAQ